MRPQPPHVLVSFTSMFHSFVDGAVDIEDIEASPAIVR